MATPPDPPAETPASRGSGHQPERPKRPEASNNSNNSPGSASSGESSHRQPTRRMPAHELPDQSLPPRPTRPPGTPDPLRHMPQRRQPNRPYWGPPIVPGSGAGWQGEAPGGLPPERYIGRTRQYVLLGLIALVTVSLAIFFVIYWNRDDGDTPSNQQPEASAPATDPDRPSESADESPSGSEAAFDEELAITEVTAEANSFYSQARAGQYELILSQSCAELDGAGTDEVAEMSDLYDDLLSWTVEDVEPVADDTGSAVVTATLRYAGSDESEESLLFIDEGGWRYCGVQ